MKRFRKLPDRENLPIEAKNGSKIRCEGEVSYSRMLVYWINMQAKEWKEFWNVAETSRNRK